MSAYTPGSRWKSAACTTELVLVRSNATAELCCGGKPVIPWGSDLTPHSPVSGAAAGTLLGKRYYDAEEGIEVICTKGGAGHLTVSGRPLMVKEAKKLPSSD